MAAVDPDAAKNILETANQDAAAAENDLELLGPADAADAQNVLDAANLSKLEAEQKIYQCIIIIMMLSDPMSTPHNVQGIIMSLVELEFHFHMLWLPDQNPINMSSNSKPY